MNKSIQAKHLSDNLVLAVVRDVRGKNGVPEWASTWDICEAFPGVPAKVVCAKLGSLVRRGFLRGPQFPRTDERGDFEIVEGK